MPKGYDGKVGLKPGVAYDKQDRDKTYESLADAMKREADCGCGFDCCDGSAKFRDQTNGHIMRMFFEGGSLKFTDLTTGVTKTVTAV